MIGVYLKFNMLDFVLCLLCLYQRLSAGGVCSITQQSPSQGGGEGGGENRPWGREGFICRVVIGET